MRGTFGDGDVDKIYLHSARIKNETARKIRKLIEREREASAKESNVA
jgi:hypothetical protein